jgi:hypothetical protein
MKMEHIRKDHESPLCIEKWGWKYHHTGIPTKEKKAGERYLPALGIYVSGFSTSPYGIEWMRYDEGCSIHPLIQTIPHIAFEVDNLDQALSKQQFEILSQISSPSEGVRVAMIKHDGAPIELIEFNKKNC